jgi:hypothetical protein
MEDTIEIRDISREQQYALFCAIFHTMALHRVFPPNALMRRCSARED